MACSLHEILVTVVFEICHADSDLLGLTWNLRLGVFRSSWSFLESWLGLSWFSLLGGLFICLSYSLLSGTCASDYWRSLLFDLSWHLSGVLWLHCGCSSLNALGILREISFTFWRETVKVDIHLFCLTLDLSWYLGLLRRNFLRLLDLRLNWLFNWLFYSSLLSAKRILSKTRFIILTKTLHVNSYIFCLPLDLGRSLGLLLHNFLRLRDLRLRLVNWLFDSTFTRGSFVHINCLLPLFSATRPVSFCSFQSTLILSLSFICIHSFFALNQLSLLLPLLCDVVALIKPLIGALGALALFLFRVRLQAFAKLFIVLQLSILGHLVYHQLIDLFLGLGKLCIFRFD